MVTGDKKETFLGIDIGSVTIKLAVINDALEVVYESYHKHHSRVLETLLVALKKLRLEGKIEKCRASAVTGSGRRLIAGYPMIPGFNEIVAQARAVSFFYPEVRTIIEIGGEDSKYIRMHPNTQPGVPVIADERMNDLCAAGTGVFIEAQANKMNISLDEFSELSVLSENPVEIAGRCTVFAKTDVATFQQRGESIEDIAAGVAYAAARNYIGAFSRGRKLEPPILFQGGVAANKGLRKAFREILGLGQDDFSVAEHFLSMPAIGSAIMAKESLTSGELIISRVMEFLEKRTRQRLPVDYKKSVLPALKKTEYHIRSLPSADPGGTEEAYLGIDVGSTSTSVVLLDKEKNLLAKSYVFNEGSLMDSVNKAYSQIKETCGAAFDKISVKGTGITGSGRHIISKHIHADLVADEITAQAQAAVEIDPDVDTVFEIGGQDSKYMRIAAGGVRDFEMNKLCSAGTGSFLQEQAASFGCRVEQFGDLALAGKEPIDMGTRCSVFIKSDIVHHQQNGARGEDIIAGLSYSVARNYLERVVGTRPVGEKVLFLGGVAFNSGVCAALEELLGRRICVPGHNEATGAIGVALLALAEHARQKNGTAVRGAADIREKDNARRKVDLFSKREELLFSFWDPERNAGSERIGVPRCLLFYEYFPLWCVFLQELGFQVVVSDITNRSVIDDGLKNTAIDNCLPNKVVYGHIEDLKRKKVDKIFMPAVIEFERKVKDLPHNFTCLYIQTIAQIVAYSSPVECISPVLTRESGEKEWERHFMRAGLSLGKDKRLIRKAVTKANEAQQEFRGKCGSLGMEVLRKSAPDEHICVVLGKPYNVHDAGLNLFLAEKLAGLGVTVIPYDCFPLAEQHLPSNYRDMVWEHGQDLMRAARVILDDSRCLPVLVSNFACGTDSFVIKYLERIFATRPFLVLEVDEHTSASALLTRCEAFLNSIRDVPGDDFLERSRVFSPYVYSPEHKHFTGTIYVPHLFEIFRVFSSVFQAFGVRTKYLPPHDAATERLGKKYSSGRECLTYTMLVGDVIRMTQDEEFDPDSSAFLLPNANIPCRFSLFAQGAQLAIKDRFPDVTFIAPRTSIDTDEVTRKFGPQFARLLSMGVLGMELLDKKLLQVRPYELNSGDADRVYVSGVERVCAALSKSGFLQKPFLAELGKVLDDFDNIPVDKSRDKCLVGVLGYDYTRSTDPDGSDLIRSLEALGAEVWVLPLFGPYLDFARVLKPEIMARRRWIFDYIYDKGKSLVQQFDTGRVNRAFTGRMKFHPEPGFHEMIGVASRYLDRDIEASLQIILAYAAHFIQSGVNGLAVFIGFHCIVHSIADAALRPVMDDYGRVPLLSMHVDSRKRGHQDERLEAFMHQVKQNRKAREGGKV